MICFHPSFCCYLIRDPASGLKQNLLNELPLLLLLAHAHSCCANPFRPFITSYECRRLGEPFRPFPRLTFPDIQNSQVELQRSVAASKLLKISLTRCGPRIVLPVILICTAWEVLERPHINDCAAPYWLSNKIFFQFIWRVILRGVQKVLVKMRCTGVMSTSAKCERSSGIKGPAGPAVHLRDATFQTSPVIKAHIVFPTGFMLNGLCKAPEPSPKRTLLIVFKPFLLHAWPKPACSPSYFWEQPPQSELRRCLPTFWARQLLDTMEGVSVDVRACASCQAQRLHTFGILFQVHRKECLLLFCLAPLLSRQALAANCRSRSMTSAMCCAITTYLALQCWI